MQHLAAVLQFAGPNQCALSITLMGPTLLVRTREQIICLHVAQANRCSGDDQYELSFNLRLISACGWLDSAHPADELQGVKQICLANTVINFKHLDEVAYD